jgi:NAD(P)-dependent dehydrogenase (short-subunit alcohol dehydrogenase family)
MACRDLGAAAQARELLAADPASRAAGASFETLRLDLGSLDSIRALAAKLKERGLALDALVNNAGVFAPERRQTKDGFELCLGVNFFGPSLLARLLAPLLSPGGRIINTCSVAGLYGRLDLEDLDMREDYGPFKAYARSKLAVILGSLELAERLRGRATVNALHPGIVNTRILTMKRWYDPIADFLFRPFTLSPDEGAGPAVELALEPRFEQVSGRYFSRLKERALPRRVLRCPARELLWDRASALVGLDPGDSLR